MAETPSFLGRGWGFPPTFVRPGAQTNGGCRPCRGQVEMVEDEVDISQSLIILFNTAIGERVMQPRYGCDLKNQVFEPMSPILLTFIEDLLRTAIVYHEPRIKADRLSVTPDQLKGRLHIQIDYLIRRTNSRFNFVYDFYLNETGQQP
jgi:phage baseplate assembly protein W